MKSITKAVETDGHNINYPVLVSPKLAGVRCLIIDGVAMISLRGEELWPAPNEHIQRQFGRAELNGFDGMLVRGPLGADNVEWFTADAVMPPEGCAEITFYVFDDFSAPEENFKTRLINAAKRDRSKDCGWLTVGQQIVSSWEELKSQEASMLLLGFEAVIARSPTQDHAPLRLKRTLHSLARVLKVRPPTHEDGAEFKQADSFLVRDCNSGVEFNVPVEGSENLRRMLWLRKEKILGRTIEYSHQPTGKYGKPNHPVFGTFRDNWRIT